MNYINEAEIRKTIAIMKPNNELFEIRILREDSKVFSGYFNDVDIFIEQLKKQKLKSANVYITLNEPNEACFSRVQKNEFIEVKKTVPTTGDSDVYGYDWLMIDLDPKRPSKTSSSDEELYRAKQLGNKVYKYMKDLGFNDPLTAFSGNGVHLLYKVNMAVSQENRALMEKSLKALDFLFSTDNVEVDKKNFNPARICKLYGTLSQKGANDKNRPHRMSYLVSKSADIKPNDISYLEKLCEVIPNEPERKKYNSYMPRDFDLDEWLDKYGIRYEKKTWADADKYILEECPFDSNHKAPDSCILKFRNGAISFTCFHNSCSSYKWQDLRMKYEPEAYEKRQQYIEQQSYNNYNRDLKPVPKHLEEKEGKPFFYSAKDIIHEPQQNDQIIKTGITEIDKRYRGLRKKDLTIISGQTGGAKSTLLSQIILNTINSGNNVAAFSGELYKQDFMKWMNLQAAGKSFVSSTNNENYFTVPYKYQERIAEWMEGHFWLYNNDYGFNFAAIIEQIEQWIDRYKLDMVCLDNLMAFDIADLSKDKYEAQSKFMWKLHELAQKRNVHIIVVCHPKKPMGLLNKYDISGSSDLVNAVDNVLFIYRNNQDFLNSYKLYFQRDWAGGGTNIIHADKFRFGSVDDSYYPLYYEIETKRLKNEIAENIIYGWCNAKEEQNKKEDNIKQIEFKDVTDEDLEELPWS